MLLPSDTSPIIVAVHGYWVRATPAPGRLPARRDIDPAELAALSRDVLPHLWLLDVEGPGLFRLRLIGTEIKAAGSPGKPGDYVHDHDPTGRTLHGIQRVVDDKEPQFYRGPPNMPHAADTPDLEVVLMPLADDGVTVNKVLGVTVYRWPAGVPASHLSGAWA